MKKSQRFLNLLIEAGCVLCILGCGWLAQATSTPTVSSAITQTANAVPLSSRTSQTGQSSSTATQPSIPFQTPAISQSTGFHTELFAPGLVASQRGILDEMQDATVYEIMLEIPEQVEILHGWQRVYYMNNEADPLDIIVFYLYPNLAGGETSLHSARVNGVEVEWQLSHQNLVMEIPLSPALAPGESLQVELEYDLSIPRLMGGNYGLFGFFSNILVLDQFYPLVARYDEEGWRIRDIPPNADVTFNDASFYHVFVQAPADFVIVSSGITIESSVQNDMLETEITAGPARDFYLAASQDFQVVSTQWGETRINSYVTDADLESAQFALETAEKALQVFSSRLHTYPYTEFDLISTPMEALGMEYPGIVAISQDLYAEGGTLYGWPTRTWFETVVVHETGHQWFYNLVGNDQIEEPWVDESLVQYITSLFFLDLSGEAAAESYREEWYGRWDRVDRALIPVGMPAGAYSSTEYSAIVYGRGPIFLKALEEQMGQDVFDEFLTGYVEANLWQTASAQEFRDMAETYCACDLSDMWAQWIEE